MMKAAVTPISLVLIVAIVMAMIAMAYAWGMPMIEKRVSSTNFGSAENLAKRLDKSITDIVSAGGGKEDFSIPFGSVKVIPYDAEDPDNNSMILTFVMPQPLAIDRSTLYLGTVSFMDVDKETGVYGRSYPSVTTLKTESAGEDFLYTLKMHYRELETVSSPQKGYKVALRSAKSSGTSSIVITFGDTKVTAGGAVSGGDLTTTYVDVNVY